MARIAMGLLALVLPLAGCSTISSIFSEESRGRPDCPQVGALADGANLARFRPGGGADLTDLAVEASIARVGGTCERARGDRVRVTVNVTFDAARGPAATGRTADLPWFVAVTRDGQILDRQSFATRVEFPANAATAPRTSETVELLLPAGQPPSAFSVIVSFQLSEAELAYNRRARR